MDVTPADNAATATQGSLRTIDSRSPAVTRAVALLEELARHGTMSLTDLARALDLAKSTVANLCSALEETHLIRRVDGRWALGYKVVELGQGFLASTDLVAEFKIAAANLPTAAQETVLLATLDDLDVVYLARHDGAQPVRLASDIGRRMPAVVTSLGKAMLASLPADELGRRLSRVDHLPVLTPHSHRSLDALRRDLDATRERGYAVDDQENTEGVTCIGVALPGARPQAAAVSATMLAARVTPELRDAVVRDLTTLATQLTTLPGP